MGFLATIIMKNNIDNSILEEIYSNRNLYLNYIRKYNIPEEISIDIFQDSVLSLYSSNCNIDNPINYLYIIVKNRCINYINRNNINNIIRIDDIELTEAANDKEIDLNKINDILSLLEEDERFIINEHIYEDKTFRQISEETGYNCNTIRSKLHRALMKIKNKYEVRGIEYFYE